MMYIAGSFKKGDYTEFIEMWMRITVEQVDCSPVIEVWYLVFAFFCPFAFVYSWVIKRKAVNNYILYKYSMETWNKTYEISTNNDRKINWPIICLETVNLSWAVLGTILDSVLKQGSGGSGALR